jgi:acetyl-CoA C-acetyltransferase
VNFLHEVVIVDYLRTAFSRSRPNQPERDVFHQISADRLLALVLKELVNRAKYDSSEIDELTIGCANQVKENLNGQMIETSIPLFLKY